MNDELKGLVDAVLANARIEGPNDLDIRWSWEPDRLIVTVWLKDERTELRKIRERIAIKVGVYPDDGNKHSTYYLLTQLIDTLEKAETYMNTKHREWENEGWGKMQSALMLANQQLRLRALGEEYARKKTERLLELMTPHIEPHKLLQVMMRLNNEIPLYTPPEVTANPHDEVDEPA